MAQKKEMRKKAQRRAPRPKGILWDRIELAVGLLAVLSIAALHLRVMLRAGALWRDEVSTVNLACKPTLGDFWHNLVFDPFPGLYFMTVRVWAATGWGGSDAGLRLLGFLVGLAILGALCWNARVIGLRFPFVSLLLLGFNPVVIRWGDSVRAYGLGTALILLTFGCIWRMIQSPTMPGIALAAIAAILSVQCMYQNTVLLFSICLGAIAICARKAQWKRALLPLAVGLAAALSLPPYIGVLRKAQDWTMLMKPPQVDFERFWQILSEAMSQPIPFAFWIWVILTAIALFAALQEHLDGTASDDFPRRRDLALFGAISLLTGLATFLTFLRIAGVPTQVWYYIPLLSFAALSLDTALAPTLNGGSARKWKLAIFVLISAFLAVPTWRALEARQTGIDRIAGELSRRVTAQDLVLISPWYLGITFQRYYTGSAVWVTVPPIDDLSIHRWDLLKAKMVSHDTIDPALQSIERTLKSGNRLWLVWSFSPLPKGTDPPTLPPAPESRWGWISDVYVEVWTLQANHFIETHQLQREEIEISPQSPINPFEDLSVEVASGWIP